MGGSTGTLEELGLTNALTEFCLDPTCHFWVGTPHMKRYSMGGWKPQGSHPPRASLPSPELGPLEVIPCPVFASEDSGGVPQLAVPGSSESMTIISN